MGVNIKRIPPTQMGLTNLVAELSSVSVYFMKGKDAYKSEDIKFQVVQSALKFKKCTDASKLNNKFICCVAYL